MSIDWLFYISGLGRASDSLANTPLMAAQAPEEMAKISHFFESDCPIVQWVESCGRRCGKRKCSRSWSFGERCQGRHIHMNDTSLTCTLHVSFRTSSAPFNIIYESTCMIYYVRVKPMLSWSCDVEPTWTNCILRKRRT